MHFSEYQMRLASYALLVDSTHPDGERILLAWWNGEGVGTPGWSLPGGGVDFDEQPDAGLVREVKEETGYDVEVGAPLLVHTWSNPHGRPDRPLPFKAVRVLYDATIVGGELGTLEVGGSTDRAEWVPIDALDDQPGTTTEIVHIAVSAHRERSGRTAQDR
ncbi:NUDIX hydrolase [Nocardioides rubriscoriae]|uniref:NUDIX hydrolase n=1 Tax=Nocardioides rubriscoriae TaxID=642762 RepID=UPI0011E016F5|nr:NUDIX domain-containing protein [Nocardioides rubriscoriae]